jgi:hypothetical protein
VFEETLALLTDRAAAAPVLLVLEDLHWAYLAQGTAAKLAA